MGARIYHQPRVAWDLARIVASLATSEDDLYVWFSTRVGELLGPSYRRHLYDTRARLATSTRDDAPLVEAGLWRARLEDVLRGQADLAEDLHILRLDAASRLARRPG